MQYQIGPRKSGLAHRSKCHRAALWIVMASCIGSASTADAKPTSSTKYTYYTVSGETAAEVYQSLLRRGPTVRGIKSFASTVAATSQRGRLVEGKSCQLMDYGFNLDFVIKLPRLERKHTFSSADAAKWQQFSQFVKEHELHHRAIWLDCAATIERQTRAIAASSCSTFNKHVDRIWKSVRASCFKRHDAFERSESARLMQHPFIKAAQRKVNVSRADSPNR